MPTATIDNFQSNLSFMRSQTTHIEREVDKIRYPDIQYPELIPIDTSANPFATSVTYTSLDMLGTPKWISGNADDMPMSHVTRAQFETAVYTAGIGYEYGWEELGQARMLNINLKSERAMSAREAAERFIDRVVLHGDTEKGLSGLLNNSAVTAASAPTGGWATATAKQIVDDVNDVILKPASETLYVELADTLLLPFNKILTLTTTVLSNTHMPVYDFVKEKNIYTQMTGKPLMIRGVRGLETAGSGSTHRMIAYKRHPSVLKFHMPMPHRFLSEYMYHMGLKFIVPGVFRLGGLDIRRPKAIRYSDGI